MPPVAASLVGAGNLPASWSFRSVGRHGLLLHDLPVLGCSGLAGRQRRCPRSVPSLIWTKSTPRE